jgi:hypothetical protein
MPLLHEVAHLGHAELLTPEPEKSLWFFTEGVVRTARKLFDGIVYPGPGPADRPPPAVFALDQRPMGSADAPTS